MNTRVCRDGGRVWLEGVRGWSPGEKASSVHAAQEAVMRAVGEQVDYDYLVGVSALAFRMQVSKQGFCPSSPHPFCGYRCIARSTEALPWSVKVIEARPTEESGEVRRMIIESINRGVPVQYGSEEDGIVVGYQHDGKEWICYHPMKDRGANTVVETDLGWGVAVFQSRKSSERPSGELAIEALEQAALMASTTEAAGYYLGLTAWDEYINRLGSLETFNLKPGKEAQLLMLGNAWIYHCLGRHRSSGAWYLRKVSDELGDPVAEHLRKAASLYESMATSVLRDQSHTTQEIAPFPQSPVDQEGWMTGMRYDQIQRLEHARVLEREAVAEIEAAISLLH